MNEKAIRWMRSVAATRNHKHVMGVKKGVGVAHGGPAVLTCVCKPRVLGHSCSTTAVALQDACQRLQGRIPGCDDPFLLLLLLLLVDNPRFPCLCGLPLRPRTQRSTAAALAVAGLLPLLPPLLLLPLPPLPPFLLSVLSCFPSESQ